MQRRLTQRYKSHFNVTLYQEDSPIAVCRMENISSDGAYITIKPSLISKKTDLNIGFSLHDSGRLKCFKLPVNVIHQTEAGIGLQFGALVNESDIYTHALLGHVHRRTHPIVPVGLHRVNY